MAEEYILTQSVTLTIRTEDADRLLALGSGDAALLYLWLLRNGGPSTDVFKQALGEEKCAEMFRTVLFGTN